MMIKIVEFKTMHLMIALLYLEISFHESSSYTKGKNKKKKNKNVVNLKMKIRFDFYQKKKEDSFWCFFTVGPAHFCEFWLIIIFSSSLANYLRWDINFMGKLEKLDTLNATSFELGFVRDSCNIF